MDSDFGIDLDEMGHVIDEAEVLIVRFHVLPDRLLLDMRTAAGVAPMVRLINPVGSSEERYRYLARIRPDLPLPDDITVLGWPRYVRVMRDSGIWQRITDRAVAVGGPEFGPICERVYAEAEAAERAEVGLAIAGGDGYESLWEREPA